MKRTILLFISLMFFTVGTIWGQQTSTKVGLTAEFYELPRSTHSSAAFSSNFYDPIIGNQQFAPTLKFNDKKGKQAKWSAIFANALQLAASFNHSIPFGSIGRTSPVFNPLINPANNANDYLLLQQHNFQRNDNIPLYITLPRALQVRF